MKLFKSARKKEMEEIQMKYELLVAEAESALLQKKEDIGSYYQKVCANRILAETMILFKEQVNLRKTKGTHLSRLLSAPVFPFSKSSTAHQFQIIESALYLRTYKYNLDM